MSLLITVFFVLCVAGIWRLCGAMADNRKAQLIAREQLEADRSAAVVSAIVERSLTHIRNIPAIIAHEPATTTLLSRFGPAAEPSPLLYEERHRLWMADPELRAFGERLAHIVGLNGVGVNSCWLMNAAGDAVAVGVMAKDVNYTGANYADPEYFKTAMRGLDGRQFAVGRVTGIPGLFFVSPAFRDGRFLGAVGVRANLESLASLLEQNVFLADENGVIILARNPALMMRALPEARVAQLTTEEKARRYKRQNFEMLDIALPHGVGAGNLVSWSGNEFPFVFSVRNTLDNLLNVYSYRYLGDFQEIEHERLRLFYLVSLVTLLMIACVTGGVVFVRNNREYHRTLLGINEKLALSARTDALTGCANRRRFIEALAEERLRNLRYANQFCVLSIDLDYFKQINDRHGHLGGDSTLRHFVAIVEGVLRPTDLLGRMGGEEFCILLPQTDLAAASIAAERVRYAVEASSLSQGLTSIRYTISVGVAQWRADADKSEEDILSRADALLYEAKKAGRNTVVAERAQSA